MQKLAQKYFSPEEYLALEETAEHKSEYYQGEIFAMAGGSANHNRIVRALSSRFESGLRKKNCEAFTSDMKLWIKANRLFTYPVLMVVCGEPQLYAGRDDTILNPILIIEVLSHSTEDYGRIGKFKLYRSVPTLREYVLIDQHAIHVEQYYLEAPKKWVMAEYTRLTHVLKFINIDFQISLKEIYRAVKMPAVKSKVHRA